MSIYDDIERYLRERGLAEAESTSPYAVPYAPYTLAGLVTELCDRAGMPPERVKVSQLQGFVTGFAADSTKATFTFIRELARVFYFDPANYDGILHFVPRGNDVVATIDPDDLIEGSSDEAKKQDGVIPRVVHLNYFDLNGQLEVNKQTSDRSIYIRENSELSQSTTVVLTADDAKRIVDIGHKIAIEEQRGEHEFELPDNYIGLTVGDCVTFNNDRLRLTSVELDDGFQRYRALYDRRSAYFDEALGQQPPTVPEVNLVPGQTVMELLDLPTLSSADDKLGYYFATSGASSAWKGALVELSADGGANYIASQTTTSYAVIGELTTAMTAHPAELPDYGNTIQVQLITDLVDLEPATLAEMMNRKNRAVIGNEIVCFGGATEISPGLWELDTFLRGRLHTAPVAHSIGDRFVLLDGDVNFVEAESYLLDTTLTFRATSLGTDTQSTINASYTGQSQIEPPPGYLRARRSGGDIIISWIGTGVKGGKTNVQMSDKFTGYRVDVNGTKTDTTHQTLTVTDPGGSVTITVQQINSITGAGQSAQITL